MIKSELITVLAMRNQNMFQREIDAGVNAVFREIGSALKDRKRVELRGFGAFSVKVRPARTGRNPQTGEPVLVPEKATPHFKPGKEFRARINAGYAERVSAFDEPQLKDAAE